MSNVFISYAKEDTEFADKLRLALRAEGISTWWDNNLTSGNPWENEIYNALKNADVILVLWTSSSRKSDWVKHEASIARLKGNLIQIHLDKISIIPGIFQTIQSLDFANWNSREDHYCFHKLTSAIKKKIRYAKINKYYISFIKFMLFSGLFILTFFSFSNYIEKEDNREKAEELENGVSSLHNNLKKIEKSLLDKNEENKKVTEEKIILSNENNEIKKNITNHQLIINNLQKEIDNAKKENQKITEEKNSINVENNKLKELMESNKLDIDKLKNENNEVKKENNITKDSLSLEKENNSKLLGLNGELSKTMEIANQQLAKSKEYIDASSKENIMLRESLKTKQDQIQKLEDDLAKINSENLTVKEQISICNSKTSEMTNSLFAKTNKVNELTDINSRQKTILDKINLSTNIKDITIKTDSDFLMKDKNKKEIYDYLVWADIPILLKDKIDTISYNFNNQGFAKEEKKGSAKSGNYGISYRGWGCTSDMIVAITLKDSSKYNIVFDQCTGFQKLLTK